MSRYCFKKLKTGSGHRVKNYHPAKSKKTDNRSSRPDKLQIKPSMALRFILPYIITRLWCYSAVCYSNVGRDRSCWIGLYKSEPESWDNVTYWLDGSPSTYRNWRDGEPNSAGQCVRIESGQFRDGSCGSVYHYVCKGIYFF